MCKILCNIFAALLLLLAAACGGGSHDAAVEQRAALLCGIIDECRYKDIARVDSAAAQLLAMDAGNEQNMIARNALAYAAMMQMDYRRAQELYKGVLVSSQCEIERLAADVGLMTICYRTSANREFFDYRASALANMRRISEEQATLAAGDRERFARAMVEFGVVSVCYFSNIGLQEERDAAAEYLAKALEQCDDVSLRVYARMILAGSEPNIAKRVEAYIQGLNFATNRGLVWLSANYRLLLAIALRSEALQQQIAAETPQLLGRLGYGATGELPLALATDAVNGFVLYGDGYMKIEALSVAASCNTQQGRYYEALSLLDEALADINGYYQKYYPAADSLEWNIVTYADDAEELLPATDSLVINIPECLLSVRREASCAYAGLGDKELSDINREAYLDLLRTTRMNKQMESRAQAAADNAARLYWWALAAVLALVSVGALLYVTNRRWRQYDYVYSQNLKRLLKICRNLLASLPREMSSEEEVCNAVCSILHDGFNGYAGDMRFSLLAPFEACDEYPFVYRMQLPPVDDNRTYTLYIATETELPAGKKAIIELSLPYIAVAVEEGLRIANISDEQLRLEEQRLSHALYLAEHKRENLLKRVSVSVLGGMRPYMDRMLNELRNLSRGEDKETAKRRLQYIAELTEKLDDYNVILERWIKMRRGDLSLQIERFSVRELFDIIAKSRQFFDARGITLDVKMSDAVVKADRALTLFMINTLVDNAGKFTPSGGTITVEAAEGDGYVELSVTDSGIGLSQADVERILNEKVYDASLIGDAAGKLSKNKGGGFGLMNCKGIIEKYRKTDEIFSVCSLDISSRQGKGSRFSFRLPRVVVRCVVAMMLLLPCGAAASDALFESIALKADSAFLSNVNGNYEKTFVYAAQVIDGLNSYYRSNVGGSDTLSLFSGTAAELSWWRNGLFPLSLKEDIFFNILDIRNEVAVAALATQRWQEYRYNNNIYASLYRLVHEDKGLEQHYEDMQRLANHRQAAIALLLFLLILLLLAFAVSYVRKGVIERMNSRMVLGLNSRLLAVTGGEEPLATSELAQRVAGEILAATGDAMCIERVSLLLKYGSDEAVVAVAPSGASAAAIYLHSVFESGTAYVADNELLNTLPLYVLSAGERVMIGALELASERPLSENELLNLELVARYAASVAYHSVVRLAGHYKALAATEEEAERVKFEENRLHVQNMVMDNCLSVIKHETIYYPGRIRALVEQAAAVIDEPQALAAKVAVMRELMDYYNSIFAILSGCATKQLDEMSFRLSAVSLDELFGDAQHTVARKAKKAGCALLLQYEPTHIVVGGDKDMLSFLFRSLIDAALEYKAAGELRLRAVDCGDVVRVELLDTRRTLPEEILADMFTPSKNNLAPNGGLVGMEYLVVKEIVRLHEDYLQLRGGRAEARACDGGFVIMFTLPKNSAL